MRRFAGEKFTSGSSTLPVNRVETEAALETVNIGRPDMAGGSVVFFFTHFADNIIPDVAA